VARTALLRPLSLLLACAYPVVASPVTQLTVPKPSFPHTAIEAQTRRLADFAFMTRDYKLAAAMYDILRKDYAQEKAVKYVAGATVSLSSSTLQLDCSHPCHHRRCLASRTS
jgi:hypothetical protein